MWKYVDNTAARTPKNRMYLSYKTSTTHAPIVINPQWLEANNRSYLEKGDQWELWHETEHLPIDTWLNGVRWSDDLVKQIILGFRERGLEDETLFVMYIHSHQMLLTFQPRRPWNPLPGRLEGPRQQPSQ
jgi:hypothetical protein